MDVRNRVPGWLFLVVAGGFALGAGGRRAEALPDCYRRTCTYVIGWWQESGTKPGMFIESDAPWGCYAYHVKDTAPKDAEWKKNGVASARLNMTTAAAESGGTLSDPDPNNVMTQLVYNAKSWDCTLYAGVPGDPRSAEAPAKTAFRAVKDYIPIRTCQP